MKITLQYAPWDSAGNLVGHTRKQPTFDIDPDGPDWKANVSFHARLHLTGLERGRSAAHFVWETNHGLQMQMFMADMMRLVQSARTHPIQPDGWVEGEWIIVKRGQNYGVTPFLPGDVLVD